MENNKPNTDFYYTLSAEGNAEFKDRGSRFIAYAFPIKNSTDVKNRIALLKKEHFKAVHFCFAYRLGNNKNTFRANDDGEPNNSAGKPILGQIDSKELTNVAVVVVRYFGGTLLGVPGLVNAYKTTASLVLQTTAIIKQPITQTVEVHFDYSNENNVMKLAKQFLAEVELQEQLLFCKYQFKVTKSRVTDFIDALQKIPVEVLLIEDIED